MIRTQPLALALLFGCCALGTPAPAPPLAESPAPPSSTLAEPAPLVPQAAPIELERAGCASPLGPEYFFPEHTFFRDQVASADLLVRFWYSRVLVGAREPSLSCAGSAAQRYRFLRLPSFDAPSYVRVELSERDAELRFGALSGAGGYDPGEPLHTTRRKLSALERRELLRALTRSAFWQTARDDAAHQGHDGTQWVLEGRVGAAYHVVHRWSPTDGAFFELCERFAALGAAAL